MSDPAYQMQSNAAASRQPSGPLRDWLATLSRIDTAETGRPAARPAEARRPPEAQAAWEPRVVPATPEAAPEPPPEQSEDDDVAALMAENMMLKARLRLEAERYDEVQTLLAEELRALRSHVQGEMEKAEDLRAERDLWMARAEALAQPLFQKR
ncbi:hypothetical protein OPKNFCMD_3591 [Methylobacterium crusticola]|uniref:ATPase n=1 Tax=Methylobacterium crusticola TaxID=1697972 RepID=A0ABQ4QZK1_9HYPH|nr:hypothetical protein [Methylobacterium crusticola]GJD50843.1 hypothetical protein OPKNFCMD_3591 [Methylobacterium crusticola]